MPESSAFQPESIARARAIVHETLRGKVGRADLEAVLDMVLEAARLAWAPCPECRQRPRAVIADDPACELLAPICALCLVEKAMD